MKLYLEAIDVTAGNGGEPLEVVWRRRRYQVVEIIERWQYNGKWWTTPDLSGECRHYFRLATDHEMQMEIFNNGDGWMLSRMID